MILIATWDSDDESVDSEPKKVFWEEGSPATMDDYHEHAQDTHTFLYVRPGETHKHMFPGVVGLIEYDPDLGAWKISGRGVVPSVFSVTDPQAKDEEILEELYKSKIIYKATIKR